MSGKFKVTGLKEIDAALKKLPGALAKKAMRRSLRLGAKRVKEEVESEAPVGETGSLSASVKVKSGPRSRKFIGVDAVIGDGWFKGDQYYAGFVEFGTRFQPAQPFMREAYEQVKEEVARTVEQDMKLQLDAEINKLRKK